MSEDGRGLGSKIMLAVLFLVGLAPLTIHVVSHFFAVRGEVEFPAWIEGGGVLLSVIVANRADDMLGKSAAALADSAKGWLPWKSGGTPPDSGGV